MIDWNLVNLDSNIGATNHFWPISQQTLAQVPLCSSLCVVNYIKELPSSVQFLLQVEICSGWLIHQTPDSGEKLEKKAERKEIIHSSFLVDTYLTFNFQDLQRHVFVRLFRPIILFPLTQNKFHAPFWQRSEIKKLCKCN